MPSWCLLSFVDFFDRETVLVRVSRFPGVPLELVRDVCVNALVRICAGANSDNRPYRDSWPETAIWETGQLLGEVRFVQHFVAGY